MNGKKTIERDFSALEKIGVENNKVLRELATSVARLHEKVDTTLKHHASRIDDCFKEISQVKGIMRCDVRETEIADLKSNRAVTDKCLREAKLDVKNINTEIADLTAKIKRNAEKNRDQEERYNLIVKRIWALLIGSATVSLGALITAALTAFFTYALK